MAVLRQQLAFVREMYDLGMVDEGEREELSEPVEQRLRQLEMTGALFRLLPFCLICLLVLVNICTEARSPEACSTDYCLCF